MTSDYLIKQTRSGRSGGVAFHASKNRVNGLEVAIKRFPSAAPAADRGRNFVLVHGIGVSSRYFHPVAAHLARTGNVFLIDLPGFGSAPNPKRSPSIEEHADVLGTFLRLEGIDRPVLVGHSMGTQVVSRLAVDHPEITDRLVLLAPTTNPPDRRLGIQARHLFADMLLESPRVNAIVLADYLLRCGVPYFLAQVPNLLEDHQEERLSRITAKTLVVRGDRDPIVPREWAARVASLVPFGTVREVAGPHVIMYSDPVSTARLIVEHSRP